MFRDFIPGKHQLKWFCIFGLAFVILGLILVSTRLFILRAVLSPRNIKAFLILAAILTGLPCLAGFMGFRRLFLGGTSGTLAGLAVMLVMLYRGGNWEDITSLLVLLEFFAGGFILGGLGEIISHLAGHS